jgi:hypothetical protein
MATGQKGILSRKQARFQVVDMVSTMTPLTKMAHQIVSPVTIPSIAREAFWVTQQLGCTAHIHRARGVTSLVRFLLLMNHCSASLHAAAPAAPHVPGAQRAANVSPSCRPPAAHDARTLLGSAPPLLQLDDQVARYNDALIIRT